MEQYLLSVHNVEGTAGPSREEMNRMYEDVNSFDSQLRAEGAWVFAGGLEPAHTATVVSCRNGEVVSSEGPFNESKNQLGGFWIVNAPDREAAVALAAKASEACRGTVEVRAFHELSDGPT